MEGCQIYYINVFLVLLFHDASLVRETTSCTC
jgi:hypothetical protein